MKTDWLFKDQAGREVTTSHFSDALNQVITPQCRVLYVHTGLSFGTPNPALGRAGLLARLLDVIRSTGVSTICMPAFTFSFCNGESFDVDKSKTRMGSLNEFMRKEPEAFRSADPLMSVVLIGQDKDLVDGIGHESVGRNSTFDLISRRDGVEFLFFGVRLGDCFTYMHYLEWVAQVPYRYNRAFTGKVIKYGQVREETYTLFVRYNNVQPNKASYTFEDMLAQQELLRTASVGDNSLRAVRQEDARILYMSLLHANKDFFIMEPFSLDNADPTFAVHDMVAL